MLVKELLARMGEKNIKATLLGIGPVSRLVVTEAMEAAVEDDFPLMFIASRNQVDLDEFGSGYLMGGMDQKSFVALIYKEADKSGYKGPIYICRDHGGPWQRDVELNSAYDVSTAMDIAKKSFSGDIEAGFNYIHVDPTKCPLDHTRDDLIEWTVDLIEHCEAARNEFGQPLVDYEIGTEDIRGGHTSKEDFEAFILGVKKKLGIRKLPAPTCVVGQTGTLTKLNGNEGGLDIPTARSLAEIARRHGLGFKEHNCDYLDNESLTLHPGVGISGANVAPEFGYIETSALFELCEHESRGIRAGKIKQNDCSSFKELVITSVRNSAPWKKWLSAAMKSKQEEDLFGDGNISKTIGAVCGHYVFNIPDISAARKKLYSNIASLREEESSDSFVAERVREGIRRYVSHFNLTGLNTTTS